MNLYHLRTFYYIAKYKNYTRAAEVLCVTQPAVTRQMQELQNYCNLVLFNKIGKKIFLTDAGEAIYALAEKIFTLEDQVENAIQNFNYQDTRKIKINSCETFCSFYLPSIISIFYKKFPNVFFFVKSNIDSKISESIANLDVDIGFLSRKISNPKLIVKEFMHEELVFIVSPKSDLAKRSVIDPEMLKNIPMIWHEPDCGTTDVLSWFLKKYNIDTKNIGEFESNPAIIDLVKANFGIALISNNVVRHELEKGDLATFKVEGEDFKRIFYLVYHKEKYFSKILSNFISTATTWADNYVNELKKLFEN